MLDDAATTTPKKALRFLVEQLSYLDGSTASQSTYSTALIRLCSTLRGLGPDCYDVLVRLGANSITLKIPLKIVRKCAQNPILLQTLYLLWNLINNFEKMDQISARKMARDGKNAIESPPPRTL